MHCISCGNVVEEDDNNEEMLCSSCLSDLDSEAEYIFDFNEDDTVLDDV